VNKKKNIYSVLQAFLMCMIFYAQVQGISTQSNYYISNNTGLSFFVKLNILASTISFVDENGILPAATVSSEGFVLDAPTLHLNRLANIKALEIYGPTGPMIYNFNKVADQTRNRSVKITWSDLYKTIQQVANCQQGMGDIDPQTIIDVWEQVRTKSLVEAMSDLKKGKTVMPQTVFVHFDI
jgi:hypothetical protein